MLERLRAGAEPSTGRRHGALSDRAPDAEKTTTQPMRLTKLRKTAEVGMVDGLLQVEGGRPLNGEITVRGAKNLVSKAMVAALLGERLGLG